MLLKLPWGKQRHFRFRSRWQNVSYATLASRVNVYALAFHHSFPNYSTFLLLLLPGRCLCFSWTGREDLERGRAERNICQVLKVDFRCPVFILDTVFRLLGQICWGPCKIGSYRWRSASVCRGRRSAGSLRDRFAMRTSLQTARTSAYQGISWCHTGCCTGFCATRLLSHLMQFWPQYGRKFPELLVAVSRLVSWESVTFIYTFFFFFLTAVHQIWSFLICDWQLWLVTYFQH